MNVQEYISSGILESYVVGDLTERERTEVELNLRKYPELRNELARVEATLEKMLTQSAIEPPATAKQKIMERIAPAQESFRPTDPASEVPAWWRFAAAAVLLVAVVNGYFAFTYYQRWQESKNEVNELLAQNQQLALEKSRTQEVLDRAGNLTIVSDPSFRKILLKGTDNAPQSVAQVFWNPVSTDVYIDPHNLAVLPSDRQYQLWAIVDGNPVDAGVFDITGDLLKMKSIHQANAFAITIEPRGGNEKPTLDAIQVIGNT